MISIRRVSRNGKVGYSLKPRKKYPEFKPVANLKFRETTFQGPCPPESDPRWKDPSKAKFWKALFPWNDVVYRPKCNSGPVIVKDHRFRNADGSVGDGRRCYTVGNTKHARNFLAMSCVSLVIVVLNLYGNNRTDSTVQSLLRAMRPDHPQGWYGVLCARHRILKKRQVAKH